MYINHHHQYQNEEGTYQGRHYGHTQIRYGSNAHHQHYGKSYGCEQGVGKLTLPNPTKIYDETPSLTRSSGTTQKSNDFNSYSTSKKL